MATTPKIKKVRVTNDIRKFIDEREHAASRAITAALVIGGSEAASMTPVATSVLLNSQFRHVTRDADGRIVGTVGYTADYAAAVHDKPGTLRGKNVPRSPKSLGVVWGPGHREPEFLKKGFDNTREKINDVLTGALKV